jgi:hypothetical protein
VNISYTADSRPHPCCNRPGFGVELRTGQTEDEKLSWSFSGLNCERMGVVYVAELHSYAKKRHLCEQSYRAVLMFAFMFRRGNLIKSKESERARKLICTGVSSGYRLAVNIFL